MTPAFTAGTPVSKAALTRRGVMVAAIVLALAWPTLMGALDEPFYIGLASRILIFGLVASSLNLVLGYGGMVSLGHAAYLGVGAYTVGVLSLESSRGIGLLPATTNAWIVWPAAMAASALAAAAIGAVSLRTRGIFFIMITLAFAQMLYYVLVGLKVYGGDDGLNLPGRSKVGFGLDLANDSTFYYVVLACFAATMLVLQRITRSRFGRAMRGIRENEPRMRALGFDTYRLRLACFTIGGALAGLGGALLANQNAFVSPNLLSWFQSGSLLMMLIVGGAGHLWGGPLGAVVFLLLEEVLSGYTQRWPFFLGLALIVVVLHFPRGLAGGFRPRIGGH